MDISGKLSLHLPTQTGEGKNGTWQKSGFVIETSNDKYPKKVCFTTWGDLIPQTQDFQPGEEVKVFFDVDSREYQGKWYSDIKAWKVERLVAGTMNNAAVNQTNSAPKNETNTTTTTVVGNFNVTPEDDLPF